MTAENNNDGYQDDQASTPVCHEGIADTLEAERHRWLAVHSVSLKESAI